MKNRKSKKKTEIRTEYIDFSDTNPGKFHEEPENAKPETPESNLANRSKQPQSKKENATNKKSRAVNGYRPGKVWFRNQEPDSKNLSSNKKSQFSVPKVVSFVMLIIWAVAVVVYLVDVGGSREWINSKVRTVGSKLGISVTKTDSDGMEIESELVNQTDEETGTENATDNEEDNYDEKPLENVDESPENWPEDLPLEVPVFTHGKLDKISTGSGIWTIDFTEIEEINAPDYQQELDEKGFETTRSDDSQRVVMITADNTQSKLHVTATFDVELASMQLIVIDLDEVE